MRCRSSRGGHRSGAVLLSVGFDERISVGHVDATLITPHVVHGHMAAGVLRQAQGLRAEVCERRGVAQTDLDVFLNAEPVMRSSAEHEVLRLNPTHRAGELPGQQLGEQQSAELLLVSCVRIPHLRVVERSLDAFGRHDVEDLAREITRHLERHCHKVRDVPADQTLVIDVLRQQRVQLVAEFGHALAQQPRMERHVDAGHEHEGRFATVFRHAAGGIRLQSLESGNRTGNRVLLAGEVVVDNLQELAGLLGDALDVLFDAVIANAELVRPQRAHPVVGTPLFVAFDEMVHGGAAVEHELKHGFQRDDTGEGAQRIVLAERMASEVGRPQVAAGFAQACSLGERDRGERDLRELGEVEQPVGVPVGDAVGGEFLRVVTHDGEDRESELAAGQGVGALPHLAGSRGFRAFVQDHALLLDALARVDEGGHRRAGCGGAARDELAVDAAGHFEQQAAMTDMADAFDGDFHLVVQLDHAVHVVGPAGDFVVHALVICRLHHMLGGGGQPHAMHEWGVEAADCGAAHGSVNRVEIAGSTGESGHLVRSADSDAAQQTTRGRLSEFASLFFGVILVRAVRRIVPISEIFAIIGGFDRQLVAVGAAADREALGLMRKHRAIGGGMRHMDGNHAAGGGFGVRVCPAGQAHLLAGMAQQLAFRHLQFDEMVEMDCVE